MRARPAVLLLWWSAAIALGVVLRLVDIDRSLWHDETWVANSVLEPTFRETLRYSAWLQTTPPLVLALLRASVDALGAGNAAFRVVPCLAGVGSLVLLAVLARRTLPPAPGLAALAAFALSPHLAWFATSAKQFSTDVLASTVLLALCLHALRRGSAASVGAAMAVWAPLAFLSYPALFFLPALGWTALRIRGSARTRALAFAGVAGVALATAVPLALVFIAPDRHPVLDAYWSEAYPGRFTLPALASYVEERGRALLAPFPFVAGIRSARLGMTALLAVGAAGLLAQGVAEARRRGSAAGFDRAVLLLAAPAALLAANLLGLYPIPADSFGARVVLFVFPCLALLLGESLRRLDRAVGAATARAPVGLVSAAAAALLAVLFAADVLRGGLSAYVRVSVAEDGQAAVAALAEEARPDDVLYVHGSMAEPFKLYARRTPVPAERVVQGEIGLPCCSRRVARRAAAPAPAAADPVAEEVDRLAVDRLEGRLLVFLADRPGYWKIAGRNDAVALRSALEERGCVRVSVRRFPGTRFDTYRCGSERARTPLVGQRAPASFRAP